MMTLAPTARRIVIASALPILAALAPTAARAQMAVPDTFKNLKVLPKKITKDQLLTTMRSFTSGLGVRCDYCHAEKRTAGEPQRPGAGVAPGAMPPAGSQVAGNPAAGAATGATGAPGGPPAPNGAGGAGGPGGPGGFGRPPQMDFASDSKEEKRIARGMLQMVMAINSSYLAKIKDLDQPHEEVRCYTCHHGVSTPKTLTEVLAQDVKEKSVGAAVQDYRRLKARYYGSASYDFREGSLDDLARQLTTDGKPDDALAILDLAAEEFPQSGTVPFLQGEALLAKGDKANAILKYRKALELQPQNPAIRRRLTELGES